jgi:DNA-binding MarR family transcriptional regulator
VLHVAKPEGLVKKTPRQPRDTASAGSEVDPVSQMRRQFEAQQLPGSPERAALAQALERARRSVHADIEATLQQFDLSRSRFQLLHELHLRPEGEQLGKLGTLLFVHPATVTSLVDRLHARGLIERFEVDGDRRATVARITERGDEVVQAAFRALAEAEFGLGHLSLAEVNSLRRLLVKVLADRGPD